MNSNQCAKILYIILWSIIVFLCTTISQFNINGKKAVSFSYFAHIDNYFINIYEILKEFIEKINLKQNNNCIAETSSVANNIYKNKKPVLNRVSVNNKVVNQALKNADCLYNEALKAALAKQNLILKEQFIRLQDKCALLYLVLV